MAIFFQMRLKTGASNWPWVQTLLANQEMHAYTSFTSSQCLILLDPDIYWPTFINSPI